MLDDRLAKRKATNYLTEYLGSRVPGLRYTAVNAEQVLFEYAGGWADIQGHRPMTSDTTLMAYSMSKTFTAVAILQLVQRGQLGLEDLMDQHLPNTAYHGHGITLRQLLNHTSGIPNPIPLRWVHLAAEHASFSEAQALAAVLRENPNLAFEPGRKFAYSNIGYWLLGQVIEQVAGQSFPAYVRENILQPLRLSAQEMDFVITDASAHANGYLKKYSWMNLMKGFFVDRKFVGDYEGNWLRLKSHYLNGPAFGGLIGTARGFARFLQDQLRSASVLLEQEARGSLQTQQTDGSGRPIPMTLGWHIGDAQGTSYFFKEGGGGGFHCEMRLYPSQGTATVALANSTQFASTAFLNRMDPWFLGARG